MKDRMALLIEGKIFKIEEEGYVVEEKENRQGEDIQR